jgi:soluble lytic murein transglycosylase-like protein
VVKVKRSISYILCIVLILTLVHSSKATHTQFCAYKPVHVIHTTAPPKPTKHKKIVDTNTTPRYYKVPLSHALQDYTYKICCRYKVPKAYSLIIAVMWQESNFNAREISSTDDYGLMQINKTNHAELSRLLGIKDFLDAKSSIRAGIYMYSYLLQRHSDFTVCLMSYNLGETGAKRALRRGVTSTEYSRSVLAKLKQLNK